MEGLASRFIENASFAVDDNSRLIWSRVATNTDTRYAIEDGLGMTATEINDHVRRKAADRDARSDRGPYEEAVPFDGKLERPLLTIHNTGDLYVPILLERTLKRAVDAAGRSSHLVQRIVRIAGHCSFSPQELNRGFDDLVAWARGGPTPEGDNVLGDLTQRGHEVHGAAPSGRSRHAARWRVSDVAATGTGSVVAIRSLFAVRCPLG